MLLDLERNEKLEGIWFELLVGGALVTFSVFAAFASVDCFGCDVPF